MKSVIEYLINAASVYPDKIALTHGDDRLTYSEYLNLSKAIAAKIPHDIKKSPIGILCDRSIYVPVYFMAAVLSGNFYIPIDPDMPPEKICSILDDAKPEILIGNEETHSVLEKVDFCGQVLSIKDASHTLNFEFDFSYDSKDPCYMVYTSGSTGKPKGVLKSHGAVISFAEGFCNTFDFNENEIFGNQTPFFFDAFAKDLYVAMKLGASIDIIPIEKFSMPPELIEHMNNRKITTIMWVPTALMIVARLKTFSYILPEYLKKVFFVGEVLPTKYLNIWRNALPDIKYVNLFGSSEIAGICCYYEINEALPDEQVLPMGKPLSNCEIYLVNKDCIITKPDELGEIYIISPALALCYFNDPERTEKSFIIKDFGNGPIRCFKTGDLARYDENGDLVFAARADFQIKHMGHRIELGEIESVAGALPELLRCCCLYDKEKSRLVLFCELADKNIKANEIKSLLRQKLSSYMVPNKVVILESLPINANGKIDRQKLQAEL